MENCQVTKEEEKLEELFRCGFILEEEYKRRLIELRQEYPFGANRHYIDGSCAGKGNDVSALSSLLASSLSLNCEATASTVIFQSNGEKLKGKIPTMSVAGLKRFVLPVVLD
jgi:hypothetical protein